MHTYIKGHWGDYMNNESNRERISTYLSNFINDDDIWNSLEAPTLANIQKAEHSLSIPIPQLDFVISFINNLKFISALDPYFSLTSPALFSNVNEFIGISIWNINDEVNRIFRCLEKSINIETCDQTDQTNRQYDLIASLPQLGLKSNVIIGKKKLLVDLPYEVIIKYHKNLSDNGCFLLLMSDSDISNRKNIVIVNSLGIYINSVFALRPGTFSPTTNISTNLVVLSKKQSDSVFLAEIDDDEKVNKIILRNLQNGNQGKQLKQGIFVLSENLRPLSKIIQIREIDNLVKKIYYKEVVFEDVSIEIKGISEDTTLQLEENTIYMPIIGTSDVVLSPHDMKLKQFNYLKIVLDPSVVDPMYLAYFYNSLVGKKTRKSLNSGGHIEHLNIRDMYKSIIKLPSLSIQSEIVNAKNQIDKLSLTLSDIDNNLWTHSKDLNKIKSELKKMDSKDRIETWIDSLPYPLASILWNYLVKRSIEKKVENLFYFFESLSEFLSIIILSAFYQHKDFNELYKENWTNNNTEYKEWFRKASFGGWNVLYSRLAKFSRSMLDKESDKEFLEAVLGNPSDEFYNIFNKELFSILDTVSNLRNKWKGHSGICSDDEKKKQLIELEYYLNKTRLFLGAAFENSILVSPIDGKKVSGKCNTRAYALVGSRVPFIEINLIAGDILDTEKLYLYNFEQTTPIELLPFLKFEVRSNAFYFYISIESKKVRWISYHYEKESEIHTDLSDDLLSPFL